MQALSALEIPLLSKFLIGESITRGNGAGADPEKVSCLRLKVQNLYRIY